MKFICLNGCNCNDDNDNADDNDIMIVIAIVVVIVIILMQLLTLKLAGGGGFVEPPLGFFSLNFYPSTNCQMLLHNCSLIMKTSFDTN